MTTEREIKNIESEIWSIFRKDYIPKFLVQKANRLIYKWKVLTQWKEDKTPALEEPDSIIDDCPYYQK